MDYYITGNDASLPATLNLIIGHYSKCDNSEGGMWVLEGANHFSVTNPVDLTTRGSFDFPATQPEDKIRSLVAEIIGLFIDTEVRQQAAALEQYKLLLKADNPLIAAFERK